MSGFVYAIADDCARIKIGWSADPVRRLVKIRADCADDARLLGFIPATKAQESEIHHILDKWRVRGEWFRAEGPVLRFVSLLRAPIAAIDRANDEASHPLKKFRCSQNPKLTQSMLARLLGCDRITILRWEKRRRLVDIEMLPKIEEITGIPPRDIRPDLAELFSEAAA